MIEDENIEVRRIYQQALDRFAGGWEEVVNTIGVNYDAIRKRRKKYTAQELADKLHELEDRDISLKSTDMINDPENKKYYRAVVRRCSWGYFLEKIGIDKSRYVSSRTDWKSGQGVVEYLARNFDEGVVTGAGNDKNFRSAAEK
jgi:hypothetical protein